MPDLSPVKRVRLRNLAELHGRPGGFGAPTSSHLVEYLKSHGLSVTTTDLTAIYQGEKPISDQRASAIEKAFNLSSGWLSTDHEFVFSLTPGEVIAHAKLASLPQEVKQRLYALVEALPTAVSRPPKQVDA